MEPRRTGVPDGDTRRILALGYRQELRRGLALADNVALGFASISPVVGLFAVFAVAIGLAGPVWIVVLPVVLAGQCLLLAVYAELASEFPLANGAYQWTRRLIGPAYGWMSGWIALCAYLVANTTIAYLGAPWALAVLGVEPTSQRIVAAAAVLVVVASAVQAFGLAGLRTVVRVGVAAELCASVGLALVLLAGFREQDVSVLGETLGAEGTGSVSVALLAALAVGGWAFIGFDTCVAAGEETRDAERAVPRAVLIALLAVAGVVILSAVAITLAHPDLAPAVAGGDTDPVSTAVVAALGDWADRPFALIVLIAFTACAVAAQGGTARALYSVARDGVLPASRLLRHVDRRGTPIGALGAVTVIGIAGLGLGLESTAIGSLIAFGTAAIFVAFLLVAVAALSARVRGTWRPGGPVRMPRVIGLVVNGLAVAWLAFETVNVAWPRASLAPPGAPWYQVWAAPLVLTVILGAGGLYLLAVRPDRRLEG